MGGPSPFPHRPVQSGGSQENPTFHWKLGYAGAPVDPPALPLLSCPLPTTLAGAPRAFPTGGLTSRAGLGCLSQETLSHSCADLARMRHLP